MKINEESADESESGIDDDSESNTDFAPNTKKLSVSFVISHIE